MAFIAEGTVVALGQNKINLKGYTLAARAGVPTIGVTDTGGLTTKAAKANYSLLPSTIGPGGGNWTQADVDAVVVTPMNGSGQNSFVEVIKSLDAGDLDVVVHSIGSAAVAATNELFIDASHSLTR